MGLKKDLGVSRMNQSMFKMRLIDKQRPQSTSPLSLSHPSVGLSLSDYLVIKLYHDSADENVEQLPGIMFKSAYPISMRLKLVSPLTAGLVKRTTYIFHRA